MKYIGNKTKLLDFLRKGVELTGLTNGVFFDAFAGTCSVGKFFKEKGFSIVSNDIMYYSFVKGKAYIENNVDPKFSKIIKYLKINDGKNNIEKILEYLNLLDGIEGFIYKNYSPSGSKVFSDFERQYFNDYNARKIDAVRTKIEEWNKKKLLEKNEYYILLSFLINEGDYLSNTSGTYGAFLKIWRSVALNKFQLRGKQLCKGKIKNKVYNQDTNLLAEKLKNIDITYIDPPYNQRQYSSNFHILETLALYDNPAIKGKTGLRLDSSTKSSNYCKKALVKNEFEDLIKNLDTRFIILSYNSEGILNYNEIVKILDKYCKKVKILKKEYRRFKTDNSRNYINQGKQLFEYLFVYKK